MRFTISRQSTSRLSPAFTIVELLIVIVIIAILASITIVAYNGMQSRAKLSALATDARNARTQLEVIKTDTGSYPADASSLKKSPGTTYDYTSINNGAAFCIAAANPDVGAFFTASTGLNGPGPCPVGAWAFNGDASDSTPYQNNGTVNGATLTTDRKGTANSAYNFNGTSYIIVANNVPLTDFPRGFTVASWFYPTATGNQSIFSKNGPGYLNIYLTGARIRWEVGSATGDFYTPEMITVNNWYYLVGTCDSASGTSTLYVNGAKIGQTTGNTCNSNITAPIYVGNRNGPSGGDPVYGSVDGVRMYNRALTPTEVKQIYDSTK